MPSLEVIGIAARTAARRLGQRPARSLLTVVQVALGTAAVAVSLVLLQGRAEGVSPPEVFQLIAGEDGELGAPVFLEADLPRLLALAPDVQALATAARITAPRAQANGARYRLTGASEAGPGYADAAGLRLLSGSFYSAADLRGGTPPAVIAESVARTIFGTVDAVGETITVSDGAPTGITPRVVRVVGVTADPEPTASGITPYALLAPSGRPAGSLIARARPGRAAQAEEQLLVAARTIYSRLGAPDRAPLRVSRTGEGPIGSGEVSRDPTFLIFSGFGILTLLVSLVGVFSGALVAAAERTREVGLRRALGASRAAVAVEVLAESATLSVLGALLGIPLALGVVRLVRGAAGPFLFGRGLELGPAVVAQVVVLVVGLALLVGLVPALLATRLRPVEALREGS